MRIDKSNKESIEKSLDSIARDLLLKRAIRINDSLYSFIDIELYYWHEFHPDDYARGIDHIRPKGEFEAHRYGVDLSLGNDKGVEFGGVLICGLYDITQNVTIGKSHVLKTMFNQLKQGENRIELISNTSKWTDTFKSKRMNLGEANTDNKKVFIDSQYKYLAKDSDVFKSYKKKEIIFRSSDLKLSEIQKILGYNLK